MTTWSVLMAAVMIGVDPHKGSHTAVVIGAAEEPLGELRVRASAAQAGKLAGWAAAWPERTWAVEGAGGLGHLLAQQLVAAGERVLDVQPKLASRVRLLQAGDTNKNDPNDALSVAVAALRSTACRPVAADDYAAVLKVWSKRHRDLARARNQVACRLHAVLCDLVPGGHPKEISAAQAGRILAQASRVSDILCAGLFPVRFRMFIRNCFLALSDVVLPGLSRGSAEPDFPCRFGADAVCPGFPGVLCCCGRLLPDPPGIAWRAVPVCH
jgi:Transposase